MNEIRIIELTRNPNTVNSIYNDLKNLGINEGDTLFYLSLSKSSFLNSTAEEEYLIHLSEQMLNWWELKQDIPQKIKNLKIRRVCVFFRSTDTPL